MLNTIREGYGFNNYFPSLRRGRALNIYRESHDRNQRFRKFDVIRKKAFEKILEGNEAWLLGRIDVNDVQDMFKTAPHLWRTENPDFRPESQVHYFFKALHSLQFIERKHFNPGQHFAPELNEYELFPTELELINYVYRHAAWAPWKRVDGVIRQEEAPEC